MGQIQRHQPLYEQLMWRIKSQVASGALRSGDKLPSVREMALIEGLNPNTVAKAYKALEQQQVIETIAGKGAFVLAQNEAVVDEHLLASIQQRLEEVIIEAKRAAIPRIQLQHWIDLGYGIQGEEAEEEA
ncbi:GntR family transcriptional regulator [Leuconostoc lactis]